MPGGEGMEGGQEGGKEHGGGARKSGRGKAFTARQLESNFMPAEGGMEGGQEGGKGHGGGANTGGRGGMEGGQEGGKEHGGGAKKGSRGKAFGFPELMCCMWAALGTNERFSAGAATTVRLTKPPRPSVWISWPQLAQTSFLNSTPWSCTFTCSLGPPAWVAAPARAFSRVLQQFRKL